MAFSPPLSLRFALLRRQLTSSSRKRNDYMPARPRLCISSVRTPDHFDPAWYTPHSAPLDVELSHHTIAYDESAPTDHVFAHPDHAQMCMVDYSAGSQEGRLMMDYIRHRLAQKRIYGAAQPQFDLRAILTSAISSFGSPPGFSAMLLDTSHDFLRVAWVGSCGFVLIRDNAIVYRSYGTLIGRNALEHALDSPFTSAKKQQNAPSVAFFTPSALAAQQRPHINSIDCSDIHVEYFSLQDNDLIICGTDGFFSNVSEQQIIAFVRPVPDLEDATLAIANSTCLGSWRYDDAQFIAYYLAIIAANFATATNSTPYLPYPFPPSPYLDDITVISVVSSFAA